ncbi:hypothetical protein C0991_007991 [Blastosporella zonata]|nr:hypothetical protein C0991_007991 [Blastosporella zonata]
MLLNFPPEIVIRILCFLDLPDLTSVSTTHSSLRAVVKASHGLQFRYAACNAGVEVNPNSNHVASERLSSLRLLEAGWSNFNIDFRKSISVKHKASGLYDLTGGICVLGDANRQALHHVRLPSNPNDVVEWSKIHVDQEVVDFGLCLYEHDLIAVLTFTPHPSISEKFLIEIRLLQFSTGKPHPLAREPVLFVRETNSWTRPSILMEIVGNHLVLVLTHVRVMQFVQGRDRMYVFEWKTGTVKLKTKFPRQTYHGVVFLSPTILCLPNIRANTLDIWLIPSEPIQVLRGPVPQLHPFMKIGLPELSARQLLLGALCRAEPNPAPGGTLHSSQPFHASSGDAIVIFNFRSIDRTDMTSRTWMLFVHRSTLLGLCMDLQPDHSPQAILENGPEVVHWETEGWGQQKTYWIEVGESAAPWITTTAGQRCVIGDLEEGVRQVTILDFNPHTIEKVGKGVSGFDAFKGLVLNESIIDSAIFEVTPQISLPYVRIVRGMDDGSSNPFRGVILDEERLLGIKLDEDGTITEIEVMHIGSAGA